MQQNFNRFVEGDSADSHNRSTAYAPLSGTRQSTSSVQPDSDRKDFWDSFGDDDAAATSPVKRSGEPKVAPEKKDFWDSFGEAPRGPSKEKKGFWDEFAEVGAERAEAKGGAAGGGSSIGSRAMKGGGAGKTSTGDGWGDW